MAKPPPRPIDPEALDKNLAKCGARQVPSLEKDYEKVQEPGDPPADPGLLGQGTYGKVFRCRRVTPAPPGMMLPPILAIKELDKRKATASEKSLKHIMVEIAVLKNIRHPNIIGLYEVFYTGTKLYLVMEFCKDGELYSHIVKHKSLPADESAIILKQMLMGLAYLHDQNIVHRDMKPENVMIDIETKHIRIIDFGLSKYCGTGGGAPGTFDASMIPAQSPGMAAYGGGGGVAPSPMVACTPCGTELYSALESITGILNSRDRQPWQTTRSRLKKLDVYGTGVITYAMLTGRLPFRSQVRPTGKPSQDRERRLYDLRTRMRSGLQFPPAAQGLPMEALNMVRAMMHAEADIRVSAKDALQLEWMREVEVPAGAQLFAAGQAPPPDAKVIGQQDTSKLEMSGPPPKKGKKPKKGGASSPSGGAASGPSDDSKKDTDGEKKEEDEESMFYEEDGEEEPKVGEVSKEGWAECMGGAREDDDDQDYSKAKAED